jgi:hypothetical protein
MPMTKQLPAKPLLPPNQVRLFGNMGAHPGDDGLDVGSSQRGE